MRRAKARSAERGESLKQMFVRLLEREVAAPGSGAPHGRVSLPLVGSDSERPAVTYTNRDLAEILDHDEAEQLKR